MPYTAQFFAEKLNVPVEYFNPLRNVQVDPSVNLEDLARVAHSLGEVVGLGLRNLAHCPVELNLMPESTLKWQAFNHKKPYFIATVFSLVVGVLAVGYLFAKLADVKNDELGKIKPQVEDQQRKADQFKRAYGELNKARAEVDQITSYLNNRYYWADVLSELKQILIRVEDGTRAKLRADTGVWIENLTTANPMTGGPEGGPGVEPAPPPPVPTPAPDPEGGPRRRPRPDAASSRAKSPDGEVDTMQLTFRAISATSISPEANKQTAFQVLDEIKTSAFFDATNTVFNGDIGQDEPPGTFTFKVTARLKHPLKL
jgi:hypothetical protein